jgi:hypothetical protein
MPVIPGTARNGIDNSAPMTDSQIQVAEDSERQMPSFQNGVFKSHQVKRHITPATETWFQLKLPCLILDPFVPFVK